ncbi:sensor histidine kinase [Paenibacillus sp. NFR01]|uniref:sensor histidine kinase n=1 Tax=Paenibacillus sp. NFR01 TaxID=1566279 RepID=UPI0008AC3AFA|nr:sensor histidine kinase [Paenibacillus sp. NFR01]SEU00625.1 Signal transduction histidine kinase [Paenibacillus sp. NFR01]
MKRPSTNKTAGMLFLVVLLLLSAAVPILFWSRSGQTGVALHNWDYAWDSSRGDSASAAALPDGQWEHMREGGSRPQAPGNATGAWLRFTLPADAVGDALLLGKLYGSELKVYVDQKLIYAAGENEGYNGRKVIIPLPETAASKQVYVWSSGGDKGFGLEGKARFGSYKQLLTIYVKEDLMDMVIGSAMLFIAVALLVCLLCLRQEIFAGGYWLTVVIFSYGGVLITYSSFMPILMKSHGRSIEIINDVALFVLLPAFTIFFGHNFAQGPKSLLPWFRRFQVTYSAAGLLLLVFNVISSYQLDPIYKPISTNILGVLMIVQFMYLLYLALIHAYKGSTEAFVFSAGFTVFSAMLVSEVALYFYTGGLYHLIWWKWGMVVFTLSLIAVVGRKMALNFRQTVKYSRELEQFNNELQRSEKMEIISELAASVAHEVRNPLQVTRGFLQLLGQRSGKKEKEYLQLAMEELDRASGIITDFLTFAKPGMDTVDVFDVGGELRHVTGVLMPLANLQGGSVQLKLADGLHVKGSASKFKQAFINLIKNSIESLGEEGLITVTAWKSGEYILVSVVDNGEGMKASELARLGEPYYSNKTKGTGLGLMVTFRIVEAMNGSIAFKSKKGEGTEVIVKLPASDNL